MSSEACPEQRLELRGAPAALAQPGGVGVAQAVRAQAGRAGGVADDEHHLADAGGGQPAALPGPQRFRLGAAVAEPGAEAFACRCRDRHLTDLVALAVQADRAGADGEGEVVDVEAGALLRRASV